MKFWELTSTFRTEPHILDAVLSDTQWLPFQSAYTQFSTPIATPMWDAEVPDALARSVANQSNLRFRYYPARPSLSKSTKRIAMVAGAVSLDPLVQVFPTKTQGITLVHGLLTCTYYFRVYRRTSMHAGIKKAQDQYRYLEKPIF